MAEHSVDWWLDHSERVAQDYFHELDRLRQIFTARQVNRDDWPAELLNVRVLIDRLRDWLQMHSVPLDVVDCWRDTATLIELRCGAVEAPSAHELVIGFANHAMIRISEVLVRHRVEQGWRATPRQMREYIEANSPSPVAGLYTLLLRKPPSNGKEYTLAEDMAPVVGMTDADVRAIRGAPASPRSVYERPDGFAISADEFRLLKPLFKRGGLLGCIPELENFFRLVQREAAHARRSLTTMPIPTSTVRQPAAESPVKMVRESHIIDALKKNRGPMKGHEIAAKAGYPFNSRTRATLARLVKGGVLKNNARGYRLVDAGSGTAPRVSP